MLNPADEEAPEQEKKFFSNLKNAQRFACAFAARESTHNIGAPRTSSLRLRAKSHEKGGGAIKQNEYSNKQCETLLTANVVKACVRVGSVVGGRNVGQSACRDAGSMRVCVCVCICVCCVCGNLLSARNVSCSQCYFWGSFGADSRRISTR
jgi:hypothetical protein